MGIGVFDFVEYVVMKEMHSVYNEMLIETHSEAFRDWQYNI